MAGSKLPFVDFYAKHKIIPTRQDISDLRRHVERREALYRHLGLPTALFRDANVLEFGPGSGHNAIVTGLMGPKRYLLVDGNPTSIQSTRCLLRLYCPDIPAELKRSSILAFKSAQQFDVVLAESLIPTQNNPARFLKHVASFVKPKGVLVFTTMDAVSLLPEMLRRWLAWRLTQRVECLEEKVHLLVNFFAPDINALPGMSRPAEDWVLDQLLHPWSGPLFSIPNAVNTLGSNWAFLGSSPRFLCDWRWYKDIHGKASVDNAFAIRGYYQNLHNLVDYRYVASPLSERTNLILEDVANSIHRLTFQQEHEGKIVSSRIVRREVIRVVRLISQVAPVTATALSDFAAALAQKHLEDANYGSFRTLWGRGQQYLSFVRC